MRMIESSVYEARSKFVAQTNEKCSLARQYAQE